MKHHKKLGKRILASVLSTALLASTSAFSIAPTTVSAADNDYYQALALSLYFYDANACGSDAGDGPLTWRGDCHTEDGACLLSNATNFDGGCKSLVDPDGDGKVDLDGGSHDAGDHIKFNLTIGFAMSSLAMSEYLNPGIYEKAGCRDHLEAILKRNAEYLMKTTFLDGSGNVATIAHVVADGGADHSMMTPPEEQHYDRASYWLTANSNNGAVCGEMAAALAGTAWVLQNSDSAFAAQCTKYAKAIYNFGKAHPGNETCGLGGFYDTDSQNVDELLLAQAWLYIIGAESQPSSKPSGGQYDGAYDCYRYSWDKVFQGYSALMYKKTNDTAFANELKWEVNNAGGVGAGRYNGDGWGAARYNCALQMSALAAANGDKNSDLATGSKWQMDYILGGNPTNYSFLIGYGNSWPTHYHHRAANPGNLAANPAAKYCLYGALVGGIDASGNYEDHSDKYQYTEPALDYNACFALACAGLANLYGGSDKGASKIVSGASEIKYPYSFGSGNSTPTPTDPPQQPTDPVQQPTDPVQQPTDPVQQPTNPPSSGSEENLTVTGSGPSWNLGSFSKGDVVTVTVKVTSGDWESNGCFNVNGNSEKWTADSSSGSFTVDYTFKSDASNVEFTMWWPTAGASIETAKVKRAQASQPQPTDPPATQQPTNPPATQQPTDPKPGVSLYGDVDCNGKVDIVDVIALNKNLMIGDPLGNQGLANADVDNNGAVNEADSLNILKSVVKLITLPV